MQKKQVLIDGKIMTYYTNTKPVSGDRSQDCLVFLHGWMQDGKSFEEIFKILESKNVPYYSLDLPGFGGSQLPHRNMNLDDYAQCVIGFLEKLEIHDPILIGHSFGGKTILNLQSKLGNIKKIILICSAGVKKVIPFHKYIIIKTGKIVLSLPGLRSIGSRIKTGFSSPDYKNAGKMTEIFRNVIADDYTPQMKKVNIPTLLIWGNTDDQTPLSDGEYMHKNIQNSHLEVLNGGHFVHQEQPKKVSDMILNFLKR